MEECVMATTSYRGVRKRKWGKWVSEIREPGKKSRIWLGSYEAPEMAATAYDVAALHLRGRAARLNFPELAETLPRPKSSKAEDVQFAAQQAALRFKGQIGNSTTTVKNAKVTPPRVGLSESQIQAINESPLDSPKMWMQMAEKLMFEFDYCYDDYDQSIMMLNSDDHDHNLELSAWEDIHLDSLWS